MNRKLTQYICWSSLAHLLFFSLFSISFGKAVPRMSYRSVVFLGQLITPRGLLPVPLKPQRPETGALLANSSYSRMYPNAAQSAPLVAFDFKKPQASIAATYKMPLAEISSPLRKTPQKKELVVMFYPLLSSQSRLYFKDRRSVHIELFFNIRWEDGVPSVVVKRKTSSGSLEFDLLAARYIERYILQQSSSFPPDLWQTVKIDLSSELND